MPLFRWLLILGMVLGNATISAAPQSSTKILQKSGGNRTTGKPISTFPGHEERALASVICLTREEIDFLQRRLLPPYYSELKRCFENSRKAGHGKSAAVKEAQKYARSLFPDGKENFTADFGDPLQMLDWARAHADNGELEDLITSAKAGDVILSGPQNYRENKKDVVCRLTNGPYDHAVLVVDGPPPVFIEAMGIAAQWGDSKGDRVRYGTWYENYGGDDRIRLIRPAKGFPGAEARRIIDGAMAYARRQLGKPYDYGFSNADDQQNFYCSELVYKAFRDGGGMTQFLPKKSSRRDRLLTAINDCIDAMEPKDRFKLNDRIVTFTLAFLENSKPDDKKVRDFIVDEIIPECRILAAAFPTAKSRERVRRILDHCRKTWFFDLSYQTTAGSVVLRPKSRPKNHLSYKTTAGPMVLRPKSRPKNHLSWDSLAGLGRLENESGAEKAGLARILYALARPVYENLGTFADVIADRYKDTPGGIPVEVQCLQRVLSLAIRPGEVVRSWPLIGETIASFLPGGREILIREDFTSPTDLADTSPSFCMDYP